MLPLRYIMYTYMTISSYSMTHPHIGSFDDSHTTQSKDLYEASKWTLCLHFWQTVRAWALPIFLPPRQPLTTFCCTSIPLWWQHRTCSAGLSAGPAVWEEAAPHSAAAGPAARSPCTHLTHKAGLPTGQSSQPDPQGLHRPPAHCVAILITTLGKSFD